MLKISILLGISCASVKNSCSWSFACICASITGHCFDSPTIISLPFTNSRLISISNSLPTNSCHTVGSANPELADLLNKASPAIALPLFIVGFATPTPSGLSTSFPTKCSNPTKNVPVINGDVSLSNSNTVSFQTPAGKSPEASTASILLSEVATTTSPAGFPFTTFPQIFPCIGEGSLSSLII